MGPKWADNAAAEMESDFEAGNMTAAELAQGMRELREDVQEQAQSDYDDAMGY